MEDYQEFRNILRQIMKDTPVRSLSKEEAEQAAREIGSLRLVGERFVEWLNY